MRVRIRLRCGLGSVVLGGRQAPQRNRLSRSVRKPFRRSYRLRIPTHSVRSALAVVMTLLVIGPITLTLVSARQRGQVFADLGKLARFALEFAPAQQPLDQPLEGAAPALEARQQRVDRTPANTTGTGKTSFELGESKAIDAVKKDPGLLASANTARPAGLPVDGETSHKTTEQAGKPGPAEATNASGWPIPSSRDGYDQRLRDRYLWRAWLDTATQFHARRAGDQALLVYQPGEGYAVLRAAYRPPVSPMIQPIRPQQGPGDDRAVHLDRRERPVTIEESENPLDGPGIQPPPARRSDDSRGGDPPDVPAVSSFQPWDPSVMADPISPVSSLASRVPGLRIEQVVLFQGYSTNAYPFQRGQLPSIDRNLGYDLDVGALATISWTHARPTSAFYMVYTPSHVSRMNFSEWNSTDHQLGIGVNKRYARTNVSLNSSAGYRGLQQVLFDPAELRGVPDAPANFDDLIEASQGGQLSNDEIASVLTGEPVVDKQPQTFYDNGRVLSSNVGLNVSHRMSPRMSTHFGVSGGHFRTVSQPESDDDVVGVRGLREATSLAGTAGINYQLSPSTQVGATSTVNRSYSSFVNSTAVNTSGTLRRRLGRRWTLNLGAGIGTVRTPGLVSNDRLPRVNSTWIASGGLQYSGRAHNVNVSAARNAGDAVGLGARTSYRAGAQWQWSRPGSKYGLHGRAQLYKMSIDGLNRGTRGSNVGAGFARQLSQTTSFHADYSYQSFSSPFRGVVSNRSGHRVQASWVWRPGESR